MSFQDDVRNTREAVLKDPKYKGPIDMLNQRVQNYEIERKPVQLNQEPAKQNLKEEDLER